MQRLKEAAEKAKIELSSSQQTEVNLPYITADATGPKHLVVKLTRSKLESLVESLVNRSLEPLKLALQDAGKTTAQIDEIIHAPGTAKGDGFLRQGAPQGRQPRRSCGSRRRPPGRRVVR